MTRYLAGAHAAFTAVLCAAFSAIPSTAQAAVSCVRTVTADVVALDQPLMWNRLGAQNINGAVFALRSDVRNRDSGLLLGQGGAPIPGRVAIRADKRPRPLVLRVAAGDCLQVTFQNLLTPAAANPFNPLLTVEGQTFAVPLIDDQVADRYASFTVYGMQPLNSIADTASYVGVNINSVAAPGETRTYTWYAEKEGTHLVNSHGATFGGQAGAGNSSSGLFGQVNVEPPGARVYRSDVTEEEFRLATRFTDPASGLPVIDYEARYPNVEPWITEGRAGLPVLNLIDPATNRTIHTEINAIVAGPNPDGTFPASTYPLESVGKRNPTVPNRLEPFREFASVFHDEVATSQAFPAFYNHPVLRHTLKGVGDNFMINYGSGGIGSEIISNRLGVGPMHDCLDCSYEEFFLTSYAVGDPALLVDVPANTGLEACAPGGAGCAAVGPKATRALFPGDPSNVHHSYTGDFTKFRNVHTGKEHHIFHLHNHQWLFNASDDNGNYLDAQAIGPGSGYTYEINFGGSGNRNKSAGDAIYHCHLYPHFAMGMWYLWRNHDVLETGTRLAVTPVDAGGNPGYHTTPFALQDGTPAAGARALPDGEIEVGVPISALVPLPGKPLPPLPGRVEVVPKVATDLAGVQRVVGSLARVVDRNVNPGFPFWVASIEDVVGQRPTTPPLDMWAGAGGWDGGLPRHALQGVADGGTTHINNVSPHSFDKVMAQAKPVFFPEEGTDVEKTAMAFHARKYHPSIQYDMAGNVTSLDGTEAQGGFRTNGNGLPVTAASNDLRAGGPFSVPCIDDNGSLLRSGVVGSFFSGETLAGSPKSVSGSSPYNIDRPRIYKGANFQYDAVLNKAGYHYPQQRIVGLWEDVMPTILKQRPGEPLVMRNNTFDCTLYHHTNLVPTKFQLDDFEVETPTDIIGQHIHLPKWDLTTTDGAANGWNYEDGTLAAQAVQERIHAINAWNGAAAQAAAALPGAGIAPVATLDGQTSLTAKPHPFFGAFGRPDWLGARVTLQRWFFDPVVNVDGVDRGLGIIFTHDHYGPSTHQQIGLYSTVLVEPAGSRWVHNETGQALHTRADGGPTSWQAAILTGQTPGYTYQYSGADIDGDGLNDSYREFYFEYSDFQSAYLPGVYVGANQDGTTGEAAGKAPGAPGGSTPIGPNTFRAAIKPSTEIAVGAAEMFPLLTRSSPVCLGGVPRPCPEAISLDDPGTWVVNYRNEPLGLRVYDPNKLGPDGKRGMQSDGLAGDLAYALDSRTDRRFEATATFGPINRQNGRRQVLNAQPRAGDTIVAAQLPAGVTVEPTRFPPPINAGGVNPGDPFTPMVRGYFGDRMRIKVQAGGDEETHNVVIHGLKWLQSGSGFGYSPNSGWRNAQQAGISEQFTFAAPITPLLRNGGLADYAYTMSNDQDGWWYGVWGLLRTYRDARADLFRLPNTTTLTVANRTDFRFGVCPQTAPVRTYDVSAVLANSVMPNNIDGLGTRATIPVAATSRIAQMQVGAALNASGGTLVYNPRQTQVSFPVAAEPGLPPPPAQAPQFGPLHDPTAMMYVRTADLDAAGKLLPGAPVEPLVLRARAGECLRITLRNRLPALAPDLAGYRQVAHVVPRDVNDPQGVTQFEYNLMRPSSFVGLHPQLLNFDIENGGVAVGSNPPGNALTSPNLTTVVTWYAGDVSLVPTATPGTFLAQGTPVEFGAVGLSPADMLKQATKGLYGSLIVEPAGALWEETDVAIDRQNNLGGLRASRASVTVNGSVRSLSNMWHKGLSLLYRSGAPVGSVMGEGPVAEDTYEGGSYSVNYGAEPLWFRFGVAPETPLTGPGSLAKIPNAHEAYSNVLTGGLDPVTPVFTALRGTPVKMHLTQPASNGRGSVFTLAGHSWQRAPYVCPGSSKDGLPGRCQPSGFYPSMTGAGGAYEVGSRALGDNLQSQVLSAQESVLPGAHFDFVLPSAGGANAIPGDYLFHDRAATGNLQGLWGILRVE